MAAMFFHVEERRAWIRTGTHTVVYDRDPNYGRFAEDPRGTVIRMLRIWLAEPKGDRPCLRAYLGTVTLCFIGPSFRDLCRLFRFTSRAAKAAGQSAKALRHNLAGLLRERIHQAYREKQLRKAIPEYKQIPSSFGWLLEMDYSIRDRANNVFLAKYGRDPIEAGDRRVNGDYHKICRNLRHDRHYYDADKDVKYLKHFTKSIQASLVFYILSIFAGILCGLWIGIVFGVAAITTFVWATPARRPRHVRKDK